MTGSGLPEPFFAIWFDPVDRILHMQLDGFWTLGTLAAYAAQMREETGGPRLRGQLYDVLSDSRGFAVQSAEVAAGIDALSRKGAEVHKGKTAIVVGSRLNKIQAERTLTSDRLRVFVDIEEANRWLLSERGPGIA